MVKLESLGRVEGLGEVHGVHAPFLEQLKAFRSIGIRAPVSVRDDAYIRLHGTTMQPTRTCHAPVCAKDSPTIVVRFSPLIDEALSLVKKAARAHENHRYPIFDDDNHIYSTWERIAKQDMEISPEKRRAIFLPQRGDYGIHRDSEEAKFFFQDMREGYFSKFVPGDSIPCWQIPTDLVDSAGGTIINYISFNNPEVDSILYLGNQYLHESGRALGVLDDKGIAASQD